MTRALILFTQESIDMGQAHPARLQSLLESNASQPITVDMAVYDDLSYVLHASEQSITVHSTGKTIDDYDVVYLRRIKESTAQAIAVGKYCRGRGIAVIDEEIATRPGSMGKLTQYMEFALAGLPFPATIYASSHDILLKAIDTETVEYPVIMKSVSGSRGSDNYLVQSRTDLESTLLQHPKVHFVVQSFVPNSADYRVWICGDTIGPILYRSRLSGHLNNTSQGSPAQLIDSAALPQHVLEECIRAAALLKRDVAGVDVVFENDDITGKYYFFEVNRAPQIEGTMFENEKAAALADYMIQKAEE